VIIYDSAVVDGSLQPGCLIYDSFSVDPLINSAESAHPTNSSANSCTVAKDNPPTSRFTITHSKTHLDLMGSGQGTHRQPAQDELHSVRARKCSANTCAFASNQTSRPMVPTFPSAKTLVVASAALALVQHVTLCAAGSITVMTYNTWNSNDGRESCLARMANF
jgi:hypothetical protein